MAIHYKVSNDELKAQVNAICLERGIKIRVIQSCWIGHAKELNGIPMKKGPKRKKEGERQKECPHDLRPIFTEAFKILGMI